MAQREVRVLVVEDDELLNSLICSFATDKGFSPVAAHSLAEARNLFSSARPNVALIDFHLPDGDGLSLLEELRAQAQGRWLPAVVVSAEYDEAFIEQCFSAGADDYLPKPMDFNLLAGKIAALYRIAVLQQETDARRAELQRYYDASRQESEYARFLYERLINAGEYAVRGVSRWILPSETFSGDLVLAQYSCNGDLYALAADATGHGLAAAIGLIPLTQVFRAMVTKGFQLPFIMNEMNKALRSYSPGDRFVAAIGVQVSFASQEVKVWNGGMPPALWLDRRNDLVHRFRSRHMALGLLPAELFEADVEVWNMTDDGTLLMYSDGVIEAQDTQERYFGQQGVDRVLETLGVEDDPVAAIKVALAFHTQGARILDDVSVARLDMATVMKHALEEAIYALGAEPTPTRWEMVLSGQQLAKQDIVPLCMHWFSTLEPSQALSERVFTLLSEMVNNAVDHGLLGLDSAMKQAPEGFWAYLQARDQGLATLSPQDSLSIAIEVVPTDTGAQLRLSVEDSGPGYDAVAPVADEALSGRGLGLIRRLSDQFEVVSPGNRVIATLNI